MQLWSLLLAAIFLLSTHADDAIARSGGCAEAPSIPIAADFVVRNGHAMALSGQDLRQLPMGHCVQLWGIISPDLSLPDGRVARAALDDLIKNDVVSCRDLGKRRGQHIVARCRVGSLDLGEAMLRQGHAYTQRSDLVGDAALVYIAAESEALRARRGLWADSGDGDKAFAAGRAVLADPGIESLGTFIGAWQTLIAAFIALAAAAWTVHAIRWQTNLPISIANTEKLLTRKSSLITLKEELALVKGGLETLKADSGNLYGNIELAKRYMPFWLHFPKSYDLCETTQAEIGIDFGPGGAKEFAKFRGLLRKILRLNYSLKDNVVAETENARIKLRLRDIQEACGEALEAGDAFDAVLNNLIADVENRLRES